MATFLKALAGAVFDDKYVEEKFGKYVEEKFGKPSETQVAQVTGQVPNAFAPPFPQTAAQSPYSSAPGQTVQFPTPIVPSNPMDNKYLELLRGVVKNKQSAFTNLLTQADTLIEVIPDPSMRYKAVAKMQSIDKATITNAFNQHIEDVKTEAKNFENFYNNGVSAAKSKVDTTVASCNNSILNKQASIELLRKQIADLDKQINDDNVAIGMAQTEFNSATQKLQGSKMLYDIAFSTVTSEVNSQFNSINSILG